MTEVSINKQARLSQHFTLGELCKTSAKTQDGRSAHSLSREGSRDQEEPIIINSGYRSEAVNKAVGGVAGSNHLTGCAVDIHVLGKEQAIRYACILLDIADESQEDFDELLIEQTSKSLWIHFAVRPFANRRKVAFLC